MRRPRKPIAPPSSAQEHVPVPKGGLNTYDPFADMSPEDCILLQNLVPGGDNGLRTRLGSREWCTNLTGIADNSVRSVLPFTGSKKNGSTSRLFAATDTGLWDVSASSQAPVQTTFDSLGGAGGTPDSGTGISCVFVAVDGKHYLLYWDEANGYHVYSEGTGAWAKISQGSGGTQILGVDPANLCFGMVWKGRVWMVEKDTGAAWYLPINQIYGTATKFNFGTQFRRGGPLVGLWNWTVDGGSGIDDRLVAISGGGDVVIYGGSDPSFADSFGIVGVWSISGVPAGRRIASDFGGDLLILTTVGAIPLSKLIIGNPIIDRTQYATAKISNLFNQLMTQGATWRGWSLSLHPTDNTLLIAVPSASGVQATTQLAMSLATRGWAQYRDLPIYSVGVWNGQLYFGTVDGRVCWNTDYIDGVTLADPNSYSPIDYSVITAYSNLGRPDKKMIDTIRPIIMAGEASPDFQVAAKWDFDISELDKPADAAAGGDAWDSGKWDSAVWGGSFTPSMPVTGATGIGTYLALALRGKAKSRTVIAGFDLTMRRGGFL